MSLAKEVRDEADVEGAEVVVASGRRRRQN